MTRPAPCRPRSAPTSSACACVASVTRSARARRFSTLPRRPRAGRVHGFEQVPREPDVEERAAHGHARGPELRDDARRVEARDRRATGSGALAGIAVGLSSGDWRARACLARWVAR